MPMYPYGNSENAPAADMGEAGGSNEVIPPADAGTEPTAHGFPLPGGGLPGGVFDSDYPAGPAWRDPGYPAPSIGAPPKAPPATG